MAKGQARSSKEKKKPKVAGEKPKTLSAYKQSQSGSGSTTMSSIPKKT